MSDEPKHPVPAPRESFTRRFAAEFLKIVLSHIKGHSTWFWLRLIIIVTVGMYLGAWLEERPETLPLRFYSYNLLQKRLPQKSKPIHTLVVEIGDEEYWKDDRLSHRVPINRCYLAELLRAVDQADPSVIAFDFDFRSPMPDGSKLDEPEYRDETKEFLDAIEEIAAKRAIVLPATLGLDREGNYVRAADFYNIRNPLKGQTAFGYIAIAGADPRILPPRLTLADGKDLLPLSQAVVKAASPRMLPEASEDRDVYAGSFPKDSFEKIPASQILKNPANFKDKFRNRVVLIGAAVHRLSYNTGPIADSFPTPMGNMPGVYIHANYIEALLLPRTFPILSAWVRFPVEWLLTFLVAISLHNPERERHGNLAVALVSVTALIVVACLLFYFLGFFFEFAVPSVAILVHYFLERVLFWRSVALGVAQ